MLSPVITLSGAQITTLHCQRKERKTITGREEKGRKRLDKTTQKWTREKEKREGPKSTHYIF